MKATSSLALLDANALFALGRPSHEFHQAIVERLEPDPARWGTCAITQLAFVRLSCNPSITGIDLRPAEAVEILQALVEDSRHEYLAAIPGPTDESVQPFFAGLTGYRQTTDAYLVALARQFEATLVTFDQRLRALAPEHVETLGIAI